MFGDRERTIPEIGSWTVRVTGHAADTGDVPVPNPGDPRVGAELRVLSSGTFSGAGEPGEGDE